MLPAGVNVRHPDRLWIGGEWRSAASGQMLDLVDPATEQVIGTVAEAGPDDMDAAVAAARDAFDEGPWPRIGSPERLDTHMRTEYAKWVKVAKAAGLRPN